MAESRALYLSREASIRFKVWLDPWPIQEAVILHLILCQELVLRMGLLGEGAKECAVWRRVAMAEEERRQKEAAYIRKAVNGPQM